MGRSGRLSLRMFGDLRSRKMKKMNLIMRRERVILEGGSSGFEISRGGAAKILEVYSIGWNKRPCPIRPAIRYPWGNISLHIKKLLGKGSFIRTAKQCLSE